MTVGYISDDGDADDLELIRCEKCHAVENIRIRTSTTQRLEGGRPLITLECPCGHTWKVIGTAPVRALVLRRPRNRSSL